MFKGLPREQLEKIAAITLERTFHRGDQVFSEGEAPEGFYIVAAGQVKIYKMSREGKELILHFFGPGEPIGEVAVFSGSPYPANAEALVKSELLYIARKDFERLVTAQPAIALNMLGILSVRLRQFTVQIENLSLKEVSGRLAAYLLHQAGENGSDLVTLDITKGQLASLLGTIPETLSRALAKLSEQGAIVVDGRAIRINNPKQLRALA